MYLSMALRIGGTNCDGLKLLSLSAVIFSRLSLTCFNEQITILTRTYKQ